MPFNVEWKEMPNGDWIVSVKWPRSETPRIVNKPHGVVITFPDYPPQHGG